MDTRISIIVVLFSIIIPIVLAYFSIVVYFTFFRTQPVHPTPDIELADPTPVEEIPQSEERESFIE
jgi:heme/copper-type cytochrome/quinol oxidase subunit 2